MCGFVLCLWFKVPKNNQPSNHVPTLGHLIAIGLHHVLPIYQFLTRYLAAILLHKFRITWYQSDSMFISSHVNFTVNTSRRNLVIHWYGRWDLITLITILDMPYCGPTPLSDDAFRITLPNDAFRISSTWLRKMTITRKSYARMSEPDLGSQNGNIVETWNEWSMWIGHNYFDWADHLQCPRTHGVYVCVFDRWNNFADTPICLPGSRIA